MIVLCDEAVYGRWPGNNPVTSSLLIPPKKPYMEVLGVLSHVYFIIAMQ